MVAETRDRHITTKEKTGNDGAQPVPHERLPHERLPHQRLPHERDESPDDAHQAPRGVMKQAAADLAEGLVDTDLHGLRGAETVAPAQGGSGQAKPHSDAAHGMRDRSPNPQEKKK